MSEKSILNLLSRVAILKGDMDMTGHGITERVSSESVKPVCEGSRDSHSPVVVDAVDFPSDEDADPAVAPFAPVGQQVGNEQRQTCGTTQREAVDLSCMKMRINMVVVV